VYSNSFYSWRLCTLDHDSGGGLSVTIHQGFGMLIDEGGIPRFVLSYGKAMLCRRITIKFATFLLHCCSRLW
jgi:hypothetical protein